MSTKTVGSLFAGIGGFDLGFERAGWQTKWQVEWEADKRAHLAARVSHARQYSDIRNVTGEQLGYVDAICGGFPCQDISQAGTVSKRQGLRGDRSGLFFELLRVVDEVRPEWLVLENVAALLSKQHSYDFETVIKSLAERGYVGCWRMLNARGFGVPQRRRRLFIIAGCGKQPPLELLSDAAPVEEISLAEAARKKTGQHAGCLLAPKAASQISFDNVLVAEPQSWNQMVQRQRSSALQRLPLGLDEPNLKQYHGAGNAVVPAVAEWIAKKLLTTSSDVSGRIHE